MAQALRSWQAMGLRIRSVLIVDDDDDWRAMAADVLAEAGFFVTTASDGRSGLASWQRVRAQVVLTDVQMPLMDGSGLLAALHAIERSLPVIVLTAEDLSDASSTFPGAFRVIQKPVAPDTVVSAVTEALSRGRLPRGRRIVDAARALVPFRRVHPNGKRRGRAGLAVAAGFGAAAAAAVLIVAIRGLVV
jgi:DNA-binding NtrC family response regulator